MDINRTNGANPSRQPINEGSSDASSSLSIMAVQQASGEGVVTNATTPPSRPSVIVQSGLSAIGQPVASAIVQPEQAADTNIIVVQSGATIVVESRAHITVDSGVRIIVQAGANLVIQPGASLMAHPMQDDVSQSSSSVIVQPRASLIAQQRPSVIVQHSSMSESAAADSNGAPVQSADAAFLSEGASGSSSGPQSRAGLTFEPDALPGPSASHQPDRLKKQMGIRKTEKSRKYPRDMKNRVLELSKLKISQRQICEILKKEYPNNSPGKSIVGRWIKQDKDKDNDKDKDKSQGKK